MRPVLVSLLLLTSGCRSEGGVPSAASQATSSIAPTSTSTSPARAVRIMPLGDSITQGDADHDTYRRPLWKRLEADGYDVDFVGSLRDHHRGPPPRNDFDRDHEGHWGWRVDEILDRIPGWVDSAEPEIVLIHLGSNDLFQGESIDSTIDELGELIDAVRASRPQVTFLLAQIIPTSMANANARIRELNARIPTLAGKAMPTSPVIIVDQFTGFDATRQTYDGVHPNPDGETHLSDRWREALSGVLAP